MWCRPRRKIMLMRNSKKFWSLQKAVSKLGTKYQQILSTNWRENVKESKSCRCHPTRGRDTNPCINKLFPVSNRVFVYPTIEGWNKLTNPKEAKVIVLPLDSASSNWGANELFFKSMKYNNCITRHISNNWNRQLHKVRSRRYSAIQPFNQQEMTKFITPNYILEDFVHKKITVFFL